MREIMIGKEVELNGKILCLPYDGIVIHEEDQGYFILDFSRKFEEENLNKLPALYISISTKQERYQLFKYNVILGEVKDLW